MSKIKSSVQALMVAIAWTSAKVVRIQAKQSLILDASTVQINGAIYHVVADAPINISAGRVLYFVQSDGFPGWYYLLSCNGTGFACSCPVNATYHKACSHQKAAMAYVTTKYDRRVEAVAAQKERRTICHDTKY
ncbi:MAG: hypothetical protein ACR2H5_14360 [Ktedonobacteraceae bacterium]